MKPLQNRKILLIGMGFYDYETAIANEFRLLGAEVWLENENPPKNWILVENLQRLSVKRNAERLQRHHAEILRRVKSWGRVDHVLVIKGERLSAEFITELRSIQPAAIFTAYHWDSMARFPQLEQRQKLFDRSFTFDHADAARNPQLILRPLFYRPELNRSTIHETVIDLCFVGWLHHERLGQVREIRKQADALGLSTFFYLSTGPLNYAKLKLKQGGQDVSPRPLAFLSYVKNTHEARAIVDFPHPSQNGLTMRAVESIGAKRKLITTNPDIKMYDFYHPDNVDVIDRNAPKINESFLNKPTADIPPENIDRYSLRTWALDVIGETKPAKFVHGT